MLLYTWNLAEDLPKCEDGSVASSLPSDTSPSQAKSKPSPWYMLHLPSVGPGAQSQPVTETI